MELKNKFDQIINDSKLSEDENFQSFYTETFCYVGENSPHVVTRYEMANDFLGACFLKVNNDWATDVEVNFKNNLDNLQCVLSSSNKLVRELKIVNKVLELLKANNGHILVRCEDQKVHFTYTFHSMLSLIEAKKVIKNLSISLNVKDNTKFECKHCSETLKGDMKYIFSGEVYMNEVTKIDNVEKRFNEVTL